ncbi:MAG: SPFH domain-containing protein [Bacteroidetes bacterium]|nr:SPFH domain-containing protein [Bacteroidota bacterium]
MNLWKKLISEFIDVIEWTDDSHDTMVYRFERYQNEIKYGAQLTVRESQVAVFVNEGEIADVFEPGLYELNTENLPILTTLKSWKHGFNSPFKAEVYFVSTKNFTDLKWGTQNPIMLRDPEFGPLRLRAFGTYTLKVADPTTLIREIVGTDGHFTVDEISNQLRNFIVSRFAEVAGQSKIPVLEMAANYEQLSKFIATRIEQEIASYGIELSSLLIENISLPPKVEEALDKRSSMGIIGDLSKYTQYQAAEAMEHASKNPGGGAAEGIGMGIGFGMANQMMQNMTQQGGGKGAVPPPLPNQVTYFIEKEGQPAGPFDASVILNGIKNGEIKPEALMWKTGLANWIPVSTFTEFSAAFNNTPPPLPE